MASGGDALDECLFHVKYRGEVQLLKIPWEELSFDTFRNKCECNEKSRLQVEARIHQLNVLFSVLENFSVEVPAGSKVILSLTTNLGAPVPLEDFVSIVKTFHKGNFVLNVSYESTVATSNLKFVTPMVISLISNIGETIVHNFILITDATLILFR